MIVHVSQLNFSAVRIATGILHRGHIMSFYQNERIALFIDGANLYSAARGLGFDIDYRRLLDTFRAKGVLLRAFYYTALLEEQDYSPLRPLIDWLDYNGYSVVTKPAKEFTDAAGRRRVKGNMDIELAIDALELADKLDHIVLFSGDGDFRRLVEAIQRKGKRVTVVSTIRTQPPMIADELRRQADIFIDLDMMRGTIGRNQDGRTPQQHVAPPQVVAEGDDEYDYEDDDEADVPARA